jgi:dTDP-4-dehydrorhamnose 3,5-epimerase-like enzyme
MTQDSKKDRWLGVSKAARTAVLSRNYSDGSLAQRVAGSGVAVAELIAMDRTTSDNRGIWIPGVEIFARKVHHQRHRGLFGEFARKEEGVLAEIGLWPKQWASARMFGHTAKGFHIHPPSIPAETPAPDWHRRLFVDEPRNFGLRRYEQEQWDVMFFVEGRVEMILRDVREGMEPRTMRFYIDGDNHPGGNNAGVVIPPGIAHALRVEGSEDAIMVYGTSTSFHPEFEGRIASEIETADLPETWQRFLAGH